MPCRCKPLYHIYLTSLVEMCVKPLKLLFLIAVIATIEDCEAQRIIYIYPDTQLNSSCPSSCYTLLELYDQHTENNSLIGFNTTILFIGEEHVIEPKEPGHLVIKDVADLTLKSKSGVKIKCRNSFGFAFLNITNLTFQNISMHNCGAKLSAQLVQQAFSLQIAKPKRIRIQPYVAVFVVNIHSLTMSEVTVSNSYGHGLLGLNIIGDSKIISANFTDNNIISYNYCWNPSLNMSDINNCRGGNAVILFTDLHECPQPPLTPATFTLTITNTTFVRGVHVIDDPVYFDYGSGLGVAMNQRNYGVTVRLIQCQSIGNVAITEGTNLYFAITGSVVNSSVIIKDSQSLNGNVITPPLTEGIYTTGIAPALYFVHGVFDGRNFLQCIQDARKNVVTDSREDVLVIENSRFSHNYGGAISITLASGYEANLALVTIAVIIRNSTITENMISDRGVAALWVTELNRITRRAELVIENSQITYNNFNVNISEILQDTVTINTFPIFSAMRLSSVSNVTIVNSSFVGNIQLSAIHAINSYIYFKGRNTFAYNTAVYGGGLYLTTDSVIFLDPSTQLTFENNYAFIKGGASYVAESTNLNDDVTCFFQMFDPSLTPVSQLKTEIIFINNTAMLAGDTLYGGKIDQCLVPSPSAFLLQNSTTSGALIFDYITNFTGQAQTDSVISSDAITLCFCTNNQIDCEFQNTISYRILFKYPGEKFLVSVIGIGQRGGVTPAVVNTVLQTTNTNDVQKIGRDCNNVQYQIATNETDEYLFITADRLSINYVLVVKVHLLPCPVGFDLEENTHICKCSLQLKQRNTTECDINTRTIIRLPPYWLSNHSEHLLIYDNCPFDYCKTTQVEITMQEPNISKQCAFNRTGTLCGQCKEGLSLVFGTSRCILCSNKYLALLVPFVFAGIALIVILFLLNLTVSIGTINGLIFYVNIVKINEAIFFPPGDNSLFKVFISWVNLDLGIETCFYNGMNSLAKTWLQFSFPFYMWLILAIILIALRYSSTLVKLCGSHAVPVLATVFLLSFTKLLRAIITALSLTTLDYADGPRVLWLYDGNIEFGTRKHLALLLFSIVFLITLVPYTLLLTAVQFLRKWSHKRWLKWVSKLMPIFDAYLGPYKDKHGYWTGLCLLVRVVLVLVFVFNILGDPAVNLLVIILVAFTLIILNLGQGGVYKKNIITALEVSFMFNLGMLAAATGYVRQTGGNQSGAVYTSTSVALVTFILILIYHIYLKFQDKCICVHKTDRNMSTMQELTASRDIDSSNNPQVTKTVVEIPKLEISSLNRDSYNADSLREPLLEEAP